MNAERLHAIAKVLHEEMTSTNIVEELDGLCNALERVVGQSHPQHQQSLADSLTVLYASLDGNNSENFSPAWRQLLSEMGGSNLFGSSLKRTIQEIFSRNQITPAVALKELKQLHENLELFEAALDKLTSAFEHFGIGNEQLKPGECEIGMLIPRQAVNNEMKDFAKELDELTFILNTFSEIATGKVDKLSIKTISSTDLTVYLNAGLSFSACLAVSVERVVALYQRLLEIRKLRGELQKQGVPDKQASGVEDFANKIMKEGIDKLSIEIVNTFYSGKDTGRKHELVTQTRLSLNSIANRIDRGYNIEVRVEPPKEAPKNKESAKKTTEEVQAIQSASKQMQFMKLEGSSILRLPETPPKTKKKEIK